MNILHGWEVKYGMKSKCKRLFGILLIIGIVSSSPYWNTNSVVVKADIISNPTGSNIGVTYQGHVQNISWQNWVSDGVEAGTDGQSLRVEALKIKLTGTLPAGASIQYQAHVQNIGWQSVVADGAEAGTNGQGLRVEAIKIALKNMPGYTVKYRAHVQNIGWQSWVSDGQEAGTDGQGLRIEAIEIEVVKTSTGTTPTPLPFIGSTGSITSVPSEDSIEADVTLNGVGTGSHAKLVICTPTSAVSFGLQYDSCAAPPYTGKTMAIIENIVSNNAGGQFYTRPGNKEVTLGKSYHLMLTINDDGSGLVYLNNVMIGAYKNPNLAGQMLYLRVEASGRVNNDQVYATFSNIKLKYGGTYEDRAYSIHEFKTNPTINYTVNSWNNISFAGYISGLGSGQNWDNSCGSVSDIIQFIQ